MATIGTDITQAIKQLSQAKVVAIPTETVYGLAADASSNEAIEAIFTLKQRPKNRTLALNIHPSWPVSLWAESIPNYVEKLINTFWPGPLTIVLNAQKNVLLPALIGPGHRVAFRCPNHPLTLKLLASFGKPLVAPSANPSNDLSPCSAEAVYQFFANEDLYILDGQACEIGLESTIILAKDEHHYEILRQGAISISEITHCLGFEPSEIANALAGQMQNNLYYFHDLKEVQSLLCRNPIIIASKDTINLFPKLETWELSGKNFYALLQKAKTSSNQLMLIECGLSQSATLNDRIKRYCQPLSVLSEKASWR